jgi:plasmid stabilization system protein ParE
LQAIHDFIARDSERYAAAEARRILVAVDQIALFPKSGRVVPEHVRDELRELVLPPYRIVYRLRSEAAVILTVFRANRLLPLLPDE